MKQRRSWLIIIITIIVSCCLKYESVSASVIRSTDKNIINNSMIDESEKDDNAEEISAEKSGNIITSGDFKFQIENNEAKVCSYLGTAAEIIVPNTVDGYKVTSIASDFSGQSCSGIQNNTEDKERVTSIVIPDTVETIERNAFSYFCNLKNVQLSRNLKSIGDRVFEGTSIESITIPKSLVEVTHNCYGPFAGCTTLKEVNFEKETTQITDKLFRGCASLTTVVIPGTVTQIGDWAFAECTGLHRIEIPDSVTKIGNYSFYNCVNLEYIRLPGSIEQAGEFMFPGISKLEIEIDGKIPDLLFENYGDNPSLTEISIHGHGVEIGEAVFKNQYNLKKVTLDGVEIVGGGAFFNCTGLKEIDISDSTKEIAYMAFYKCTSLESIHLPSNIEKIEGHAFSDCSNLKNIYVNKSIKAIDITAFSNVTGLTIYGYKGTYAETYAKKLGYIFKPYSVKATGLTVNYAAVTLKTLEKMSLKANITPSESTDAISWISSNKAVVTVSANGEICAKSPGTAVITVKAGAVSATCKVTVIQPVKSIVNMKSMLSMQPGTTYKLKVTVQPTNASNKALTWKSSNTKVATVSSTGKVTAKAAGTAVITCTTKDGSGKKATCKITVYNNTQAYVARIYTKALGRSAEPAGLKYWTNEIQAGNRTPVQVAEEFFFAPEFVNKKLNNTEYVKVLYRTFMGREYDKGGLDYWVARLNKGESRKSVLEAFAGCPEFQKIVRSFGL